MHDLLGVKKHLHNMHFNVIIIINYLYRVKNLNYLKCFVYFKQMSKRSFILT